MDVKKFLEAVRNGDPRAQYTYGLCYERGTNGLKQDFTMAAHWYQKAAASEHDKAILALGKLYEEGKGVEKDVNKAVELYKKAASLGNEEAGFLIAENSPPGNSVESTKTPVSPCKTNDDIDNIRSSKILRQLSLVGANIAIAICIIVTCAFVYYDLSVKLREYQEELSHYKSAYSISQKIERVQKGLLIVTSIMVITGSTLSIMLLLKFFAALKEIIHILLEIRNLLNGKFET